MTSRRNFQGDQNMYGGARPARPVEAREGIPLSHLNMMPRRQSLYGGTDDSNARGSRGKATMDEDTRLGGSRGDMRVTGFLGGGGKSRGSIDHVEHHRSNDTSPYAAMSERRGYQDDGMMKLERGPDEPALQGEDGVRFRDGAGRRGERVVRPVYSDETKWATKGYDSLNSDCGFGSLRDSGYLPATKSTSSSNSILPGFIFECHKRTILGSFSQKGSFILPFDDRRLAEQVGPGTKIFMFNSHAREIHGVFQAESYAAIDHDANTLRVSEGTAVRVRVRVAKECIPLTERQFKEILHENYYTSSKFTESLTKEQVMKLLHTFRPVDPARNMHISLHSTRRTLDSGLSHGGQDFRSISDDTVYRKEERWRRGVADTRSLSGHSYHAQEAARFSSKLPASALPTKALDDYEDYVDDEVIEDIPLGTSRLITGSTPYSNSRAKQHSLRSLSGSRSHLTGSIGHSELADADWREELDPRDLVYRKRQQLSPSPLDELKRGGRSSSPLWKDVHSRGETAVAEMYGRPGKGGYKEESSYLSNGRRRHNDIDLNVPLEMGHGEAGHVHDMDSKAVRRGAWDEEAEKGYSVSPPKSHSLLPRPSLHLSDHLLPSDVVDDDYEDSRLDSRHMVSVNRKEYSFRTQEKGRTISSSHSNGKLGKLHPRAVRIVKNYPKDKSVQTSIIVKRPVSGRDLYGKESSSRGSRVSSFHINASLQAPGRGKPERVVTMVDNDNFRPWGPGSRENFGNGSSANLGRKRKPSVWSRITMPDKGPGQKSAESHGKGRVFSRLGPTTGTFFEPRDDAYRYKNKKPRHQQTKIEVDLGRIENIENSPDALEGEDYLIDDLDASEESGKEMEKAADDLQGWTRKKASLGNSGDESRIPYDGDYANVKRGRRKLVRPSIGTKIQADESGWKHLESAPILAGQDAEETRPQPRSQSGSMDMEMVNVDTLEVEEGDSPLGSHHDLNFPVENDRPDFEEDNMMSS